MADDAETEAQNIFNFVVFDFVRKRSFQYATSTDQSFWFGKVHCLLVQWFCNGGRTVFIAQYEVNC